MRVCIMIVNFESEEAVLEWISGPDIDTVQAEVSRRYEELAGVPIIAQFGNSPWRLGMAFDTMDAAMAFSQMVAASIGGFGGDGNIADLFGDLEAMFGKDESKPPADA